MHFYTVHVCGTLLCIIIHVGTNDELVRCAVTNVNEKL